MTGDGRGDAVTPPPPRAVDLRRDARDALDAFARRRASDHGDNFQDAYRALRDEAALLSEREQARDALDADPFELARPAPDDDDAEDAADKARNRAAIARVKVRRPTRRAAARRAPPLPAHPPSVPAPRRLVQPRRHAGGVQLHPLRCAAGQRREDGGRARERASSFCFLEGTPAWRGSTRGR